MSKKLVSLFLVLLMVFSTAASLAEGSEIVVTDMFGREVTLSEPATRIVVMQPSDCEILCAIGCEDAIVGRGQYVDYPASILDVPVVQSGAETNVEEILALQPQVVLMNSMSQSEEQVRQLEENGVRVVVSKATDIEGVYYAIRMFGTLMGRDEEAEAIVADMQNTFAEIKAKSADEGKTVYFEISPLQWGLWTAGSGTFMDELYFELFDKRRNLIPIMSIEGEKEITDARRGSGIYDRLIANMDELHKHGLIFGASVTVTTENVKEVSSPDFLKNLSDRGCKVVIFVEFVPVTDDSKELAPGDAEREYLHNEILRLRREHSEMVYISFPGDEKSSGGCVAAGRGFFHINSHGGAEPCPFSPYSDINVRDTSLRDAINSKLFRTLRENGHLLEDHAGGCVLYEKRELVEQIMSGQTV